MMQSIPSLFVEDGTWRDSFYTKLGETNPDNIVSKMLEKETYWRAVVAFVERVIKEKNKGNVISGSAPIVPFIPTYAKQLGFSSVVVGFIFTLLPIMGMIAKPTMGALADRYKCQKFLFQSCLIITVLAFLALMFVPAIPSESNVEVHCHQETVVQICSSKAVGHCLTDKVISEGSNNNFAVVQLTCRGNSSFLHSVCDYWHVEEYCPNDDVSLDSIKFEAKLQPYHTIKVDQCLYIKMSSVHFNEKIWHVPYCNGSLQKIECRMQYKSDALNEMTDLTHMNIMSKYQFWMLTILLVIGWVGMAVIVSLGDAICFSLLGDFPSLYGKQRLWGAVGWGAFSIISGYMVDFFSQGQTNKDYTAVFYLMAFILSLNFLVTFKIKCNNNGHTPNILKDIGKLVADIRIVVFMIWCVFVGMCTALTWNFLFWFLEDLANDNHCDTNEYIKTLEGLVMGVQCFGGELPFFFVSGWILKKIGHVNAMSLVLLAFGVRFLLYSILTDPWWCLPIELLQGLTFSIFYATMASYASIVAPPGTENTVQGLVGAIFEGLGISLGSFIAGILFSQMKGAMVFRVSGLVTLLACVLHASVQFFLKERQVAFVADDKEHE